MEKVWKALFTLIACGVVLAIDAHAASLLVVRATVAVTVAEARLANVGVTSPPSKSPFAIAKSGYLQSTVELGI